jgi:predicted MFS family arabinose efflux permease
MTVDSLFDKSNNTHILIAGILSLVIGVGVARFAFTTLLPPMLEDHLSVTTAGYMASFNYAGYLSGAIVTIFLTHIKQKVFFFRLGIVCALIGTFILAVTHDILLWYMARVIAGFGSAMLLIIGGALVMVKLNMPDTTKAMGFHFSGIGVAIALCELLAIYLGDYHWSQLWIVFSLLALVLSFYVWHILSFDRVLNKEAAKYPLNRTLFTPHILLLIFGYYTAGVGFVIQATFLPDIINSINGLKGYGSMAWFTVGLIGIPSAILWMRLAYRYGSVNMIIVAFILQIIGILIPALSSDLVLNMMGAAFYGSTFIGHVAMFIHYGGKLAGKNPVVIMGAMTTAYGMGQVTSPLYATALYEHFGNYNAIMYLTASIVSLGIGALVIAKNGKE